MYSDGDPSKRGVAPFGDLGIKACSRLPQDFRSVPRPSSPPGAKASTRCPSHPQPTEPVARSEATVVRQRSLALQHPLTQTRRPTPKSLAQDPSNPDRSNPLDIHTHNRIPGPPRHPNSHTAPAEDKPHQRHAPTRVAPSPENATEPDSQSPKNTPGANQPASTQQTPASRLRSDLQHKPETRS